MEYAKKNFPGHQALVYTHMDGHNGSGNIHVHIIINSLRKMDAELQPFMERPCDSRAGYKHHLTDGYLRHLQQSELNKRNGQIVADSMKPRRTIFQTQKQFLRDAINDIASHSKNLEETQSRPETEPSPEPSGYSTENKHSFFEYNPDYDYSSNPTAILFIRSDLRLVVDLQNNVKTCRYPLMKYLKNGRNPEKR